MFTAFLCFSIPVFLTDLQAEFSASQKNFPHVLDAFTKTLEVSSLIGVDFSVGFSSESQPLDHDGVLVQNISYHFILQQSCKRNSRIKIPLSPDFNH